MPETTTNGDAELESIAAMRTGLMPLYHSLGQVVRGKIQSGEWPVGSRIPAERALTQMYGVSRATVRQAIEYLTREGVLYRIQGKGTFVAPPKIQQGVLRLLDFTETMRRNGLTPRARLLGKECIDPPLNVRKELALAPSEQAIWLQRLILVNDSPMLIESSYLPAARFPDFLAAYDGADDPQVSIRQRYGLQISRGSDSFEPVILESHEARLLGVKSGAPALWVEQISLDAAGCPIEFRESLLRGDRCRFYIDLAFS